MSCALGSAIVQVEVYNMTQRVETNAPVRFSADEDEVLIDAVTGNACLWNMSNPEYKNTMKKELIWGEIGTVVGKTSK